MANKKPESEARTVKIIRTDLSEKQMKVCFPTVLPHNVVGSTPHDTFVIMVSTEVTPGILFWDEVGYLCLEDIPLTVAMNTHVHIHTDYRKHSVFKKFIKNLRPCLKGYLQSVNKSQLIAGCPMSDDKTKRLLALLGFTPNPLWYGSIDFN